MNDRQFDALVNDVLDAAALHNSRIGVSGIVDEVRVKRNVTNTSCFSQTIDYVASAYHETGACFAGARGETAIQALQNLKGLIDAIGSR